MDGSGTSVNTAAVDQEICTVGTFSAAGATACTTAQQGYYTVDANGDALSDPWQGAVAEAQAGEGFFTVDQNGDAADSGAVGVQQAQSGYYTVTTLGGTTATAAGAVDEAQAAAGYVHTAVDSNRCFERRRGVGRGGLCAAGTTAVREPRCVLRSRQAIFPATAMETQAIVLLCSRHHVPQDIIVIPQAAPYA